MGGVIARDFPGASRAEHDLVVVGGGVYGVALTLEAARRGLRAVLVERDDFGGATSWNSLRIVHGGLRYLQTLDLPRFRESVAERRRWLIDFPEQVRPLACLMPLYGRGARRPIVLRAALAINDLLSARRNDGVRPDRALSAGSILDPRATVERFPGVDREGLRGAALWHDATMPDSQRLIIEMLRWAVRDGATAINYAACERIVVADGAARGVLVRDRVSGDRHEIRGRRVVNCAGPWCREVAGRFDRDVPRLFLGSIAFNALLDRPPLSDAALAVEPRGGGRTYFLVPWKGKTLAGTYHAPWSTASPPAAVDEGLVATFLDDLAASVPGFRVPREQVLRLHWGMLPAAEAGSDRLASREVIHDHGRDGGPSGLWSVSGVKFTTARKVADKVLGGLGLRPGRIDPSRRSAPRRVPDRGEIEALLRSDAGAAGEVISGIVREEAVVRVEDLLLRRTDWGSIPDAGAAALAERVADIVGWGPEGALLDPERAFEAPF